MEEWMKTRQSLSPYTQKLEVSALAKLYGYRTGELDINTVSRCRKDIKRSRNDVFRNRHFNEQKHADFVAFCRSTGLRRGELKALRGTALYQDPSGTYYIHFTSGSKGGRERYTPVIGDIELICKLCYTAGVRYFPHSPPLQISTAIVLSTPHKSICSMPVRWNNWNGMKLIIAAETEKVKNLTGLP